MAKRKHKKRGRKRKLSRKQLAAMRRNIKKARAARRKHKRGPKRHPGKKRGPGRPRKHPGKKRGPGRPRKHRGKKRGPGRPPKNRHAASRAAIRTSASRRRKHPGKRISKEEAQAARIARKLAKSKRHTSVPSSGLTPSQRSYLEGLRARNEASKAAKEAAEMSRYA